MILAALNAKLAEIEGKRSQLPSVLAQWSHPDDLGFDLDYMAIRYREAKDYATNIFKLPVGRECTGASIAFSKRCEKALKTHLDNMDPMEGKFHPDLPL